MCGVVYDSMPRPPGPRPTQRGINEWYRAMAAWEAGMPENVLARNKRRNWRRIHDYAAQRYLDVRLPGAGRFWYGVMMRAHANENGWFVGTYWRNRVKT